MKIGGSSARADGDGRAVHVNTELHGVGTTSFEVGVALGLVVNELLSNSHKHAIHAAGTLTIELSVSAVEDATGSDFYVDVKDDGPGLPDDFDPQTSDSLGMQIVQAIIARHGGRMSVVDPARAHLRVYLRDEKPKLE